MVAVFCEYVDMSFLFGSFLTTLRRYVSWPSVQWIFELFSAVFSADSGVFLLAVVSAVCSRDSTQSVGMRVGFWPIRGSPELLNGTIV